MKIPALKLRIVTRLRAIKASYIKTNKALSKLKAARTQRAIAVEIKHIDKLITRVQHVKMARDAEDAIQAHRTCAREGVLDEHTAAFTKLGLPVAKTLTATRKQLLGLRTLLQKLYQRCEAEDLRDAAEIIVTHQAEAVLPPPEATNGVRIEETDASEAVS